MPLEGESIEEFFTAMEAISEFACGMMEGRIGNIAGPTSEGHFGHDHIVMQVLPQDHPHVTVYFISEMNIDGKPGRIVGCKIHHRDYELPCLEIPPPMAMMLNDDA